MEALESAFLTNCPGDSWAYWSLRIPEKHLRPLQKIYCMHDASLPSLPFTPSLFFTRRESWRAALPFSPLISCCLLLPLLAASFFLLILGRTTVTQESYLLLEYLPSLCSTCVSFSLVIIQYGGWRGAVHTSHAAEFQFHGNHQSFPLVGWMFASLSARVTRPWMWTIKEEGVPISVDRVQVCSTLSLRQTGLATFLYSFHPCCLFSLYLP